MSVLSLAGVVRDWRWRSCRQIRSGVARTRGKTIDAWLHCAARCRRSARSKTRQPCLALCCVRLRRVPRVPWACWMAPRGI